METSLFSKSTYAFFFFLFGIVYVTGLFVPLMDNDSAHHANIALHMYLHNDYVNLMSTGDDYLDKPHLLFWLSALSYKVFGVTGFAYRFPSFCFTVAGIWSTFKLGQLLYTKEVGRLAALMLTSAFAFILANNDVRMDAMLTACVAIATWQGVALIQNRQWKNVAGLALGLALGFATKGQIAVFITGIGLLAYIIYRKDFRFFLDLKLYAVIILFAIFIAPVVYCYYLQFNMHPEKVVHGHSNINGVKFILFGQGLERIQGERFETPKHPDYFFFFHSFLWAFAPWSIMAYIAVVKNIQGFLARKSEWLSLVTFIVIALLLTISKFKLPHYINIIFPSAAAMTAAFAYNRSISEKTVYYIQFGVCIALLLITILVNGWAFPVSSITVGVVALLMFFPALYFFRSGSLSYLQKAISISATVMAVAFFMLNANFYPKLLTYQGGNELAHKIENKINKQDIYFWKENISASFSFYTADDHRRFTDAVYREKGNDVWLVFSSQDVEEIRDEGYTIGETYECDDYEITRLKLSFINPATRSSTLTKLLIGRITGKH